MKHYLTLIFLFLLNFLFAQEKIDSLTNVLVNQLIAKTIYYTDGDGWGGIMPQYKVFEDLKKTASDKDLKILLNHKDKYIRAYAYLALTYRKNIDLFSYIVENINDTNLIKRCCLDVCTYRKLGEFYYKEGSKYINSKIKQQIIDSLLIYNCGDIRYRLENYYDKFYQQSLKSHYFDSLLWVGWEKYNIIELNGLVYFLKTNKPRALENINRYFYDKDFCNSNDNYTLCVFTDEKLIEKIIETSFSLDSSKVKTAILNHLIKSLPYNCSALERTLIKILGELNEEKINDSLLNVLRQIEDPFVYAITIDSYKNKMSKKFKNKIKSDIKEILKSDSWREDDIVDLKKRYKIIGL